MKISTNQKINCYTQGQQFTVKVLLIVWLLASGSLESALATPKNEETTRPETTTSPPDQLASPSSRPIVEKIEDACATNGPGRSLSQYAQGNLATTDDTIPLLSQPAKDPGRSARQYAQNNLTTVDDTTPLLGQPVKDPGRSLRQYAQGSCETVDDTTLQLLHQAAKDQDPMLRQASASALASLATADDRTRQFLHQAAKDQDDDVREIALEALKTLDPAPSTLHTDKKRVLQKFFKQAVEDNDVSGLTKLILENIDEVGELCESLAVDLLMKTLPQTADTLLTWGVEHNKYELVQFIIERGRQHITTNDEKCVGQSVTKIAAEKGYRKLFLLLINNGVDVATRNITAFMSAIIRGQYPLAQAMLDLGEYRLEQPDENGDTPQDCLDEKQVVLQMFGSEKLKKQKEALETLLHQKIQTMNESNPQAEQQALLKKEQ